MTRSAGGIVLLLAALPGLARGQDDPIPLWMGGNGGVYFLAEPGRLTIELQKRDRNRGRQTALRAILAGPDRQVLQEATIPDDGRPRGSGLGPAQAVQLAADVPATGIYVLNLTTSQDRYGSEILWGFRTNCPRYLIETSRGHKDERHQEPIQLDGSDQPAEVCFWPRPGPLSLAVEDLPEAVPQVVLRDADGACLAEVPVGEGRAAYTVPADVPRDRAPWRLQLPVARAMVHIDGVTRWGPRDPYPDLSLWTPQPASYFPFHEYRWLLAPYSRHVHALPGQPGEVSFEVSNNAPGPRKIGLALEFPDQRWPVQVSEDSILLKPGQTRSVTVAYTLPDGQARHCRLRAIPQAAPDLSTYVSLFVHPGPSPADEPLDLPLVLQPYRHADVQFGYRPSYPFPAQVYFDPENRPFVLADRGILARESTGWTGRGFATSLAVPDASLAPGSCSASGSKIAFDRAAGMYLLGRSGAEHVLLHSADQGRTFTGYPIPASGSGPATVDIEQFSGHNLLEGPPPLVRFTRTAADPQRIWRRIHDLELLLPERTAEGLRFPPPVRISRQCIGWSAHSGIPSSVVSRGDRVHVTWAEATDPDDPVPGVPTFVATYDRRTRSLGEPALVGYGPPPNDIHNSPSITMDSGGYLHVLAGTHGQPFPYARSLAANDAGLGWSDPEPIAAGSRQTYIGLVCGPDDTLHAVFRMWRTGAAPFPDSHHGTLAYQRKRAGQPWEPPRVLVVPPFSEYSVYYHRLTIDHRGRLFVSYDYWSTYWFYRNDQPRRSRTFLMSPDGGTTWQLAADPSG